MQMSYSPAITIDNVSKEYRIYNSPQDRLKQFLYRDKKKFYKEFWALRDVSFEVEKGQTIGVVGKNGSGKSTLLQIVTQTLAPTTGEIKVNGRIAALLELGSGFNPEFTGRENVFLNGSIMGLSHKEIEERFPLIEAFAEIGDFINQPVKFYSSGMFVRLAFACAVNVDPDVLIIDEALSVGDMQFQIKCMDKMKEFKQEGKTILFVSHDTYSIKNFCDEVIWMKNGQIHMRGAVQQVTDMYEDFMKGDNIPREVSIEATDPMPTDAYMTIKSVNIMDSTGQIRDNFSFGEPLVVEVDYTIHKAIEGIVGGVAIIDNRNTYVCGLNTKLDRYELPNNPGNYKLYCNYNDMNLLPGTYHIDTGFFESTALVRFDYKTKVCSFTISSDKYIAEGISYLRHEWTCKGMF